MGAPCAMAGPAKKPPVLLSVRYHIQTGNLIFSRHIKVHSLPADRDHYSLSVTTRHADYVAKPLLLIRLLKRKDGKDAGNLLCGNYTSSRNLTSTLLLWEIKIRSRFLGNGSIAMKIRKKKNPGKKKRRRDKRRVTSLECFHGYLK